MARQLSLTKARDAVQRMKASSARARKKAGETMETVVRTAEVSGTAFGLGILQARSGDPEGIKVAGVNLNLGIGLGAHLFGLLGVGRGMESHLKAVGDGALGVYAFTAGLGVGGDMISGEGGRTEIMGALGPGGQGWDGIDDLEDDYVSGEGLDEAELEELTY